MLSRWQRSFATRSSVGWRVGSRCSPPSQEAWLWRTDRDPSRSLGSRRSAAEYRHGSRQGPAGCRCVRLFRPRPSFDAPVLLGSRPPRLGDMNALAQLCAREALFLKETFRGSWARETRLARLQESGPFAVLQHRPRPGREGREARSPCCRKTNSGNWSRQG